MTTSLAKIRQQIAKLEDQAASLKQQVVRRLRQEIEAHGLTADDLFGDVVDASTAKRRRNAKAQNPFAGSKPPKYADKAGNTWSGMGKRPGWLRDALEGGADLDDFLIAGKAGGKRRAAAPKKAAARKTQAPVSPKRSARKAPAATGGAAKPKRQSRAAKATGQAAQAEA